MGATMPGLEATAALPLMSYGMAAWLGHAVITTWRRGLAMPYETLFDVWRPDRRS